MKPFRASALLSLLSLVFFFARPVAAQLPIEPAKLPARTTFYVAWHGMPAGEARKANSLFALWDDPALAPTRDALAQEFVTNHSKDKSASQLSRADLDQFASLFDNSYILGYLPEPKGRATAPASVDGKKPLWNGIFFVYNHTGKETLMFKLFLGLRMQKDAPEPSPVTIGGVPATKFTYKNNINNSFYWADKGEYTIATGERAVMEEVFARLDNKSTGASLGSVPAFQEAQPLLSKGTFELFLRIPDLADFVPDTTAQGIKSKPILDALRLDAVHSVAASVSFEGARTHLQGGILGDTSPGTLFDIFGDGQPSPASLAFASSDTIYFNSTLINLPGIYSTLKRVVRAVLPPGQQSNADLIDTMAQAKLGMSVNDALALLTGEVASIQSSPVLDFDKHVYFFGIRDKAGVLKLMHTLLGERISSERSEGNTTFLKISLGGNQSSAGVAQWNFYNLAVTPDAILGAFKADVLRATLTQRAQNAPSSFASHPGFQAARAGFPQNVDGIHFTDFQKFDWPGVKDHWLKELKKTSTTAHSFNAQKATAAPSAALPSWLEQIDPQIFARHLHAAFAASWKDGHGFHFDEWVE
jgi:hypothetical protein